MPEPMIALLIGVTLANLIASLCWAEWLQPRLRARKPKERGAFCVWCQYRRGDLCTHPGSPVYHGKCGPVCIGAQRCGVKQERRRW